MYSFQVKLETVKVLGRGGFGNVILVKREFDKKLLAVKVLLKDVLTLARPLFATPGAPGAGQCGHFRLSKLILRGPEAIATNAFFQKQRATFSDRHNYSKHELYLRSAHNEKKSKAQIFEFWRTLNFEFFLSETQMPYKHAVSSQK